MSALDDALAHSCPGWIGRADYHVINLVTGKHVYCASRVQPCLSQAMDWTQPGRHIVVASNTGSVYYDDDQP